MALLGATFILINADCLGGNERPAANTTRPTLVRYQGRYFSYATPKGWRASESTNGVDMNSPDGSQQAFFILLLRNPGRSTPEQFALRTAQLMRYQNFRVLTANRIPNQPRGMVASELEFSYIDPRLGERRAGATIAIATAWGLHDAYTQWYASAPHRWEQARLWLPVLARGVAIINPREVAGNDTLLSPRNNPLDNSGLIASWKEKGLSQTRISQGQQEGTMGYERVRSPTTGKHYDMPLELYDGTKGGYHNPDRPDEILHGR